MTFTLLNCNKLKIALNQADLDRLEISYETMDYADTHTRAVLVSLLSAAKEKTGFSPADCKLFIEVYPDDDGCVLYVTAMHKTKTPVAEPLVALFGPVVFKFDNIDQVILASCKLFYQFCHRIYKSSLYKMENGYRLIIYPMDTTDSLSISFLCEYGTLIGDGEILASFIEEHGDLVILDNAIDTISLYLS